MHIDVNVTKDYLEEDRRDKIRKIINEADTPSLAILIDQLNDKNKIKF